MTSTSQPPTIESSTTFGLTDGIFIVDNFVISSVVRELKLSFWSDGIDLKIPDNAEFYSTNQNL
jgi:hypothetical protein